MLIFIVAAIILGFISAFTGDSKKSAKELNREAARIAYNKAHGHPLTGHFELETPQPASPIVQKRSRKATPKKTTRMLLVGDSKGSRYVMVEDEKP